MKSDRLDVLAVIRAPLEGYPPSLNQVALMTEAGLRAGVVDCEREDYPEFRFADGSETPERIRVKLQERAGTRGRVHLGRRIAQILHFNRVVRTAIASRRPRVVIAYDPNGMAAVGKVWRGRNPPKLVWHFHEFYLPRQRVGGLMSRRAFMFAWRYSRRADLIVFPDADRLKLFREMGGVCNDSRVVMNCPRRIAQIPSEELTQRLPDDTNSQEIPSRVYFQGSVSATYCLEAVVRSMRFWPDETLLVLVGPVSENFRRTLVSLAQSEGVESRIVFLGLVPYTELAALAAGATVGLSLVMRNDCTPNLVFSAGASNKRFEYMAVGLPQVANEGPGMVDTISDPGCGLLVDPDEPEEIGKAVANLLGDQELHAQMAAQARQAHLGRFSYERQFESLRVKLEEWCSADEN